MRNTFHKCFYRLAVLALFSAAPFSVEKLQAQSAVMIRDINQSPRAAVPQGSCTAGTTKFIFLDDGIRGNELWVGDGIAGTTRLLKEINPGPGDGVASTACIVVNNVVYFVGKDAAAGRELWRSDGSAEGTYRVKDIEPGAGDSDPGYFTALGSNILFAARTTLQGNELWRSDGTDEGTTLVTDLVSGSGGSFPSELTLLANEKIAFAATAGTGRELHITDGTASGTSLLLDINPGAGNSNPAQFALLDGVLLFAATSAAEGRELWKSDGTPAGTVLVKDVRPGAGSGIDGIFDATLDGKLMFTGNTVGESFEPWITDGTTAGTMLLKDINPGGAGKSSFPSSVIRFGNRLFFTASNDASGYELWSTDGTTSGTVQQSEIGPGALSGLSSFMSMSLSPDGSKLIFTGSETDAGNQLYATEGTAFVQTKLLDIAPGTTAHYLFQAVRTEQYGLPVSAPEPVDSLPPTSTFVTDGTLGGTDLHPGTLVGFNSNATPILLGQIGGSYIFAADDGTHGVELWKTDGSASGTTRITDINSGFGWSVQPQYGAAVLNDKLLFVANTAASGAELWATNGSSDGTVLVKDIEAGSGSAFAAGNSTQRTFFLLSALSGGRVIFPARTTATGVELWITDGSTSGTQLLKDILPGAQSSVDTSLSGVVTNSKAALAFAANDGANGTELWITNGTTGGTVMLADINPGASSSNPGNFAAVPAGALGVVFSATTAAHGNEYWFYNGATTTEVLDIVPGANSSSPRDFEFVTFPAVKVFFSASTVAAGRELWISDGSGGGTSMVKDILSGVEDGWPSGMTAVNSRKVIFSACSKPSLEDCEPWVSDGTALGTQLLKDIRDSSATESSAPSAFAPLGTSEVVYFLAFENNVDYKVKVYRTDMTTSGTTALDGAGSGTFGPQILDPFFHQFQPAGSDPTVLFPFMSESQGFELYKVATDECPSDSNKSSPGLCGCGAADADGDGDGALDCLEGCPSDPLKSAPGICGCGAADLDTNGNGVMDCLDAQIPGVTPPKALIRRKGKRFEVTLTPRTGASFLVETRVIKIKGKKKPFKGITPSGATFNLKRPKPGFVLQVRYRYQINGDAALVSAYSAIAAKKG